MLGMPTGLSTADKVNNGHSDRGAQARLCLRVGGHMAPLADHAVCLCRITPFQSSGGVARWANDAWGRLLYRYYNWRQDTGSDLLLIIVANMLLVVSGAVFKDVVVDPAEGLPRGFWANIYDVRQNAFTFFVCLRKPNQSMICCFEN